MDQLEIVSKFVPAALLKRLAAENREDPVDVRFDGAVLYADIYQYTILAERLCEQGTQGLEQLATLLNDGFSTYVGCVAATGGEVAEFAGDALFAYWASDKGGLESALQQAKECASLLHRAFTESQSDASRAVPLHIGIGTGDIWAAKLGGFDGKWQLLMAGDAVRDATRAALQADAGETVLLDEACKIERKTGQPGERAGQPGMKAPYGEAGERLSTPPGGLVPRVVQEWISEGLSQWLPQLRHITALFVNITGLDVNAPDALRQFQALVESLQTSTRPYSNSSGTLLVDDKGLVFKLCLGLPNDSHSDDILRAVRAGFAIESELARLGLDCAIGVASGQGICMPLGGRERQHYVPVGRFMHMAARLMQEAGEGMVCTDKVADQIRHELGTMPMKPVALKGIGGSTRPFRIQEPQQISVLDEKMFGRSAETKLIDRCLDNLGKGDGRVLWVVGGAGLGKTMLVNYLRRSSDQHGFTYFEGGSASMEVVTPYVAWRPIFSELMTIDPQARRQKISRLPHPELAPLVNTVLDGLLEETETVRRMSDETRAKATIHVLSQIIGQFTPSEFVLVLEDCHWMDSASWRLLARVVQDHPGALIFLTSRPTQKIPELSELRKSDLFTGLELPPLHRDAVRDYVQYLVQQGVASARLVDDISDRALGNPLYAREYALLLSSRAGTNQMQAEGAPAAAKPDVEAVRAPETVQGLITSRLDALSADEALVLKSASVLGDRFRLDILEDMRPVKDRGRLEDCLARLIENQMLVSSSVVDGVYDFRHALIREVTYEQLTSAQRKELHIAAARAIEQICSGHLEPNYAALAHHWQHTGNTEAFIRYADLASSQALKSGAYLEAARWLRSCIDLPMRDHSVRVNPRDRIRWSRKLADAHHGLGHPETRGSAAREALAIAGRNRPHSRVGIISNIAKRTAEWYWLRLLPQTRKQEKIDVASNLAQAYRHSAEVCYFNNDLLGMIHDCLGAARMSEQAPISAVRGSAWTELGGIIAIGGLRGLGENIQQQGLAIAEDAGEPAALAHVHMVRCLYAIGTARWDAAEAAVKKCQELCEPIDDSVTWTNAQAGCFWINHYQYRSEAAEEAAQQLQDRAHETGNRQHQAWAQRFLALCDLRWQRPEAAEKRLQNAMELLGETAAINERIPTFGLLAQARLHAGDVWSARATARDAIALLSRVGRPIGHSTLAAYSALAEIVLDAWRQDPAAIEWRNEVNQCLKMLKRYQSTFPVGQARYFYHNGEFEESQQRFRQARRAYGRGERTARRLGMPREAELCATALARLKG